MNQVMEPFWGVNSQLTFFLSAPMSDRPKPPSLRCRRLVSGVHPKYEGMTETELDAALCADLISLKPQKKALLSAIIQSLVEAEDREEVELLSSRRAIADPLQFPPSTPGEESFGEQSESVDAIRRQSHHKID
ncbi:MAG: hypothetical protein AAFR76_01600 [Planctomycetota bacterium]